MVSHAERAREAGTDVLWWTDHSGSYYVDEPLLEMLRFDFEDNSLQLPGEPGGLPPRGFAPHGMPGLTEATIVDTLASQGERCMSIATTEESNGDSTAFSGYRFELWDNTSRMIQSLYKRPRVHFDARLAARRYSQRKFAVHCTFSNNLDGETIAFVYLDTVDQLPADESGTYYFRLPRLTTAWHRYTLDVLADAATRFDYPEDLSLQGVSLGWQIDAPGYSSVLIDDFSYSFESPGPEAIQAMQLADVNTLAGGSPTHFVGYETSGGTGREEGIQHHVNVFAPQGIPDFPDYLDPRFDHDDYPLNVVRWAHSRDYTVSYNHLYGAQEAALDSAGAQKRENITVANGAYEADLLEVGYADRRRPIESFMGAWDNLARWSAFPTGIGTTDDHNAHPWAVTVNRFVTWVYAGEPVQEKTLVQLQRGRACFGDPLVVGPDAYVTIRDHRKRFEMGDVVVSPRNQAWLDVIGEFEPEQMSLTMLTVHAEGVDSTTQVITSPFKVRYIPELSDECHVRVELRDMEAHSLTLASNPIYFRREAPSRTLPGMRHRNIVSRN